MSAHEGHAHSPPPCPPAQLVRDEKTYRAAQRTYLLDIVSCREVQLEVRVALFSDSMTKAGLARKAGFWTRSPQLAETQRVILSKADLACRETSISAELHPKKAPVP